MLLTGLGLLGLVLGLVLLLSPIPVGALLITLSVSLLVVTNEKARSILKNMRSRYVWLNKRMHRMEAKLEHKFVALWHALSHTRPDTHQKEDATKDEEDSYLN